MPTNTATSFTSHTGNGTAGPFSISFSFFAETDIKVLVGGEFKTLNTHYTFTSGSQITFTSGNEPGNGVSIKFTRNTDISSKKIDFEDGSVLTEADLDTQNDQILFALQEFTDIVNNDLLLRDGSNTVIGSLQFEGSNDDNFETKITVENPTTDRTITLPNITGTVVTRSDTGTVTSTMISPGTIVNGDINPAANINGSKLSNDSVSLAKLGGGALPTDITIASANIVNGSIIEEDIATGTLDGRYYTETELDAGQLDNRYFTETELNSGQLDNRYFTESELNSGQLDNRYFTETELSSGALDARYFTETELTNGTLDSRYFTETELNNGQLDNRYFTETELNPSATTGANVLDARYYTEAEADARFYNLASSEEIQSGETWTAADNKVATTAAIDARIIDLVDDVGGFVPITNELSFPNTNPDINNGAGTLISIQALSTAYTSNGSGTFTIANGTIGNSTVTVTGATASTTFTAGFGMILETTSTLNTYTFHRLVPKATEVTTVAGNVSNVNTVAGIDSNVTTVAGIAANVTTVAGISSNVTSVAGSITNVNTVATNLSGVNAFADRYSSGSSNPTSNLDVGDLFFNTTDNELKVYNGSAWQSGVTATSNVALTTGNTFTGNNVFNDNVKALFGTGNDLQIFHSGTHSFMENSTGILAIRSDSFQITDKSNNHAMITATADGSVELYFDNSKKFNTTNDGGTLTGNLFVSEALQLNDNKKIEVGNSADLQIFHDGSNSRIVDSGTGNLILQGSRIVLNNADSSENMISADENGAVQLYHDNSLKLNTNSNGVRFHGNIEGLDNEKIRLGNSEDLQIYHDGTRSEIINNTGDFIIQASANNKLMLRAQTGESHLIGYHNAQVELYYDGSKKAETSSAGFKVTGACFVNDGSATGNRFSVGNGGDLKIFHTNPGSFIQDTSLRLAISSNVVDISDTNGDKMAEFTQDGSAKLYHNGSQKLATSSSGVSVTGTVDESSDIALKSDIQPLTNTLEKLQQITGYKYNLINSISPSMGVIAQDVEKVFPELVHGSEGNKTLQYSGLIGVLVEAVKDLSAKVAALEAA